MRRLSAYANGPGRDQIKTLLEVFLQELDRARSDVESHKRHIDELVATGAPFALEKAQSDVGMSREECDLLIAAIDDEILMAKDASEPALMSRAYYGDRVLKAVYAKFKEKGKLLDVVAFPCAISQEDEGWQLADCKFGVRRSNPKLFSGQRSFYRSVVEKFIDVEAVLSEDQEPFSPVRRVFVLSEILGQVIRQFNNMRLAEENFDFPVEKQRYRLCSIFPESW